MSCNGWSCGQPAVPRGQIVWSEEAKKQGIVVAGELEDLINRGSISLCDDCFGRVQCALEQMGLWFGESCPKRE